MAVKAKDVPFTVDLVGEVTGEKFWGEFRAKTYLSFRDELQEDKFYRDLLGIRPEDAQPRAKNQAKCIAQLWVRLTETPDWWKERGNGLDISDDNVIESILLDAVGIEARARSEIKTKGTKAVEKLRDVVSEDDKANAPPAPKEAPKEPEES
jgi:hypothetical protein